MLQMNRLFAGREATAGRMFVLVEVVAASDSRLKARISFAGRHWLKQGGLNSCGMTSLVEPGSFNNYLEI
jgi:hypothetical protein